VDAIREVRITEQTYYRWRKQYGGMGTDQLKELKRLQKENERLRKAVSDLTLDKLILPRLPGETSEPRSSPCLHRSCAQWQMKRLGASYLPRSTPASLDPARRPRGPCR
jgi:putative transposase